MKRPSSLPSVLVIAMCFSSAASWSGIAAAGEVQPFSLGPIPSTARTERSYWIGTGATREEALALRDQLVAAGARNVNLFVPDMVIVCDVPVDVAHQVADVALQTPFRPEKERDLLSHPSRVTNSSWGWIVDSYALAERTPDPNAAVSANAGGEAAFNDVVLTLSPEQIDAAQREVLASRARDTAGTRPPITRKSNQNSEFLGGYILANFIFPESNGVRDVSTEDWTDEDLQAARTGAAAGLISWQRFGPRSGQMAIGWVINHYERIPTRYEPITHDMTDDGYWIVDTMRSLGWGLFSDGPIPVVHEFNESERATWHTHWAVTSFIATSRNIPNHIFKSGSANYTAYAFLGGPYMVEPFPAGTDPNNIGEPLVFSQIATHEIGHQFWTLDEYPNSPGACGDRSGYLNIENGNQTMTIPGGGSVRCHTLVPCIMHTSTRFDDGRPWCEYSKGQLGIGDFNNNGYIDIFEAEPEITFVPEGPETVTTNNYTLRFRAKARAVPNRNSRQAPDDRVSYALPINGATLNLGALRIGLDAADGRWDEVEEDCEFTVSLSQVGLVAFSVYAENEIKYKSPTVSKLVYFAGVRYDRVVAQPKWNRMEVSWETTGETFGAKFDVYRLEGGQPKPGTLVAQNVSPVGTGSEGQPAYKIHDFDVEPGRDYRYYIDGVFQLPYEGGVREYRSASATVGQIAMVQVASGDVVSNVAPNPTNGAVTFSVSVPRTMTNTPRGPLRVPTNVDIRVYDVRGQLVRTLKTSTELNSVVTMRWDGTTQNGVPAPSGIYFLRVKTGEDEAIRKVVLLR